MTTTGISDMEQRLGLRFPQAVKTFLRNIGQLPPRVLEEAEVLQTREAILALNSRLRTEGFYHLKWPPEFFAIGSDPGGCIYLFDLRTPQAPVLFADYDDDDISEFKKLADTPEGFVVYLREMVRDWEEQERRIPPAPSARNILAAVQGDLKGLVRKIVLLSTPAELETWWLEEVGWHADEKTIDAAVNQRLEFLINRAKERGWEI